MADDPKDVSLGESLAALRAVKKHFQALEKVGVIIEGAVDAQKAGQAAEAKLRALEPTVEELQAKFDRLKTDTDDMEKHFAGRKKVLEARHKARADELNGEAKAKAQEVESSLKALENRRKEREQAIQNEVNALISQRAEAQNELKAVQDQLDSLKKQVAGVHV